MTALIDKIKELRDRHGRPNGTTYEEGSWDGAANSFSVVGREA